MLLDDTEQTIGVALESLEAARRHSNGELPDDPLYSLTLGINDDERKRLLACAGQLNRAIDPVAQFMIGATNGISYRDLIGEIDQYAIPKLRLPPGANRRLLDVGCNWGRWSVAASRAGYRTIGIDPSLGAVLAARRVCRQLGVSADFVVGDARFLPFADGCLDTVFSYSVIQHFSKPDARTSLAEIGRVLQPGGTSLIQMPNIFGIRCLYHQFRRGVRAAEGFEVRYWTLPELQRVFSSAIGPTELSVDCFFGIGLQFADAHLMPAGRRYVMWLSEHLRALSRRVTLLRYVADSVYVASVKRPSLASG